MASLEVIEHVENPAAFVSSLAALTRPGGMLTLSTINRTAKVSRGQAFSGHRSMAHLYSALLSQTISCVFRSSLVLSSCIDRGTKIGSRMHIPYLLRGLSYTVKQFSLYIFSVADQ